MAATAKTTLPEESELTVPELNVSWPVLQTASVYIGKACEWYNNVSNAKILMTRRLRVCIRTRKPLLQDYIMLQPSTDAMTFDMHLTKNARSSSGTHVTLIMNIGLKLR